MSSILHLFAIPTSPIKQTNVSNIKHIIKQIIKKITYINGRTSQPMNEYIACVK